MQGIYKIKKMCHEFHSLKNDGGHLTLMILSSTEKQQQANQYQSPRVQVIKKNYNFHKTMTMSKLKQITRIHTNGVPYHQIQCVLI